MSSERRHELEHNELADVLSRANTAIEPYSKPIAFGVAALLVGLVGWAVYASSKSDRRSDATFQLLEASGGGGGEALADISVKFPGTSAASWAQVYLGSEKLAAGINSLFSNRGEAETLLDEAASAYKEAIKTGQDPVLLSRAHFGLARVAESLGKPDEAIASYEAAMVAGESKAMAVEAKQRIERLSNPQTKEFLVWFNEQNFAPADPAMPPSLPGAAALPDLPDLELPDLKLPPSQVPAGDAETTSDDPAMETEPPVDAETPAADAADAPEPATKVSGMTVKDEPTAPAPVVEATPAPADAD